MKTKTEIEEVLKLVQYPKYSFRVGSKGKTFYLQAYYDEPDTYTGKLTVQTTRKWLLSPHMTKSELVQTALKCILTSAEHRVREGFTYRGQRVFGPHFDVDALHKIARRRQLDVREAA